MLDGFARKCEVGDVVVDSTTRPADARRATAFVTDSASLATTRGGGACPRSGPRTRPADPSCWYASNASAPTNADHACVAGEERSAERAVSRRTRLRRGRTAQRRTSGQRQDRREGATTHRVQRRESGALKGSSEIFCSRSCDKTRKQRQDCWFFKNASRK